MSTINMTKHLRKQGLNKTTLHEAEVVNNKDPDRLGRIRVRIKELHQGIKDEHLPWCIPRFGHIDGAKGGDDVGRSGTFYVPKKGTKVLVEFQDGNPHYPIWHGYTVDDKSRLKETNKNYPDRAIVRFSSGAFVMYDSKTNELFVHNPGDLHMIVQGDVEMNVHGNMQEVCHTQKSGIDKYFTGDKDLPIGATSQKQNKKTNFQGLGKKSGSGNRHLHIEGDYTIKVNGDMITKVKGDYRLETEGKVSIKSKGDVDVQSKGDISNTSKKSINQNAASDINLNADGEINLTAAGAITLTGSTINLN